MHPEQSRVEPAALWALVIAPEWNFQGQAGDYRKEEGKLGILEEGRPCWTLSQVWRSPFPWEDTLREERAIKDIDFFSSLRHEVNQLTGSFLKNLLEKNKNNKPITSQTIRCSGFLEGRV